MKLTRASWLLAAVFAAALGIVVTGQQPAATAVFTLEQAAAGRAAYNANCASCHRPDLGGFNEAPQLAGGNFMNTWRERTMANLVARIDETMPPGNAGAVSQAMADRHRGFHPAGERRRARYAAARANDGGALRRRRHAADSTGARGRAAPAPATRRARGRGRAAHRPHHRRRSPQLRAGHRRDAAQPAGRRLADGAAQLPGLELQPVEPDQPRQRQEPAPRLGVGDGRSRREPADAARAQRHHLPGEHQQHHPGAQRPRRRADLGVPRGSLRRPGDAQPRDLRRQDFRHDERRAHARARCPDGRAAVGDALRRHQERL